MEIIALILITLAGLVIGGLLLFGGSHPAGGHYGDKHIPPGDTDIGCADASDGGDG